MTDQVGYLTLLRRNIPFRRLWYGQIVSQLGDWFDSIALYTLLYSLTGSGQAVGGLLVAQFLPSTIVGPWAGVIVDRLPRRLVLIASDIGRGLLVLLFLFVRRPEDIWIVYVVSVLKFSLTAFFEPARSALTPDITRRDELVAANAISGATWSAMLALGAAVGGLVVGTLGTTTAFFIDSASFFLSALLIAAVHVKESHGRAKRETNGWQELRAGASFIAQRRDVAIYTFTKGLWSLGGGVMVLLTLFGREVFPLGKEGALSIGLFYAARGVGAGIGPLIVQRWSDQSARFLRRAIGPAFLVTALGYLFIAGAPPLWLALLAVMLAHMGGSTQWVFGTTLIQLNVPGPFLGRVFAVELAALTLTSAASSYLFGLLHDLGWSPYQLAILGAILFTLPGLWLMWLLRGPVVEDSKDDLQPADPTLQAK